MSDTVPQGFYSSMTSPGAAGAGAPAADPNDPPPGMYDRMPAAQQPAGGHVNDPVPAGMYGKMEPPAAAAQPPAGAPGAAPASSADATGDVELPPGFKPDATTFPAFKKLASELGLDGKAAGRVLSLYTGELQRQQQTRAAERTAWQNETRRSVSRDEIAGAASLVKELGTPALVAYLNDSGAGDHPEVVKLMARVAAELRSARGRR